MKNTNTKKIIWMMDETIAHAHPSKWQLVRKLEDSLINIIGNPKFEHQIIDPIPCLGEMARQLRHKDYTSIFDLTGWLTPAMQELFPYIQIEDRFSLSRVRVVSSPVLETTGYKVSMSPEEIEEVRRTMDMRRPLIVDDVGFSGRTSREIMNILGVDPKETTHAFLIANTGYLGDEPGAVPMLESMGGKVILGYELRTPMDDGWHLKDLHQNPNLDQAFELALTFQEKNIGEGSESRLAREFFDNETVINTLFPDHLTSIQIRELMQEGRFVLKEGREIERDEIHAKNPFLWSSLAFQEHVDIERISARKAEVMSILWELRSLTTDPEAKREASEELRQEIMRCNNVRIEGEFNNHKERH